MTPEEEIKLSIKIFDYLINSFKECSDLVRKSKTKEYKDLKEVQIDINFLQHIFYLKMIKIRKNLKKKLKP